MRAIVLLVLVACTRTPQTREPGPTRAEPVTRGVDAAADAGVNADTVVATAEDDDECVIYDARKYACRTYIPGPDGRAVEHRRCPDPPDANIEACRHRMPCPDPPDPRVLACQMQWPVVEVTGRVIRVDTVGSAVTLVIGVGEKSGVTRHWRGELIDDAGRAIDGGALTLIRVDQTWTLARTTLPATTVVAYPRVRLTPQ